MSAFKAVSDQNQLFSLTNSVCASDSSLNETYGIHSHLYVNINGNLDNSHNYLCGIFHLDLTMGYDERNLLRSIMLDIEF